ncbi:MAG: DUF885 domain-containing protein [Lachnospiraceae bacterium]|nr:DUF885 domain-containing protein [Lachnospiraceae bacterium]
MKKKKYFCKLLSLLMVVVLLTSCGKASSTSAEAKAFLQSLNWIKNLNQAQSVQGNPQTPTEAPTLPPEPEPEPEKPVINTEYNFSIYDNNLRTYTDEELSIQAEFKEFLNGLFVDSMESNYLNLIYTVENPEAMGIKISDDISWGECSIEAMEEGEQENIDLYNELTAFDYNSLDYEGQLIYDTLKTMLENEMTGYKYWYFAENLSPLNGIQTSIPIMLAEIEFTEKKDIDNYLMLVNDTKRFIDDVLTIEKYRSENYGLFLTDAGADDVINQCNEFIDVEENILISSFDSRIDTLDFLSDTEKKEYKEENKTAVNTNVIPAFKAIAETLPDLKGTRLYNGLCEYEHGDEYYAYIVCDNSSTLASVSDLLSLTEKYIDNAVEAIQSADMMDMYSAYYPEYPYSDPRETLDFFADKLTVDFPAPATTEYEVKYVPKSLEASSSPAFYIIPPIDNINKNIIYINGSDEYANTDLYSTLAHEGYPGHLYQCSYFNSLNPNPIRSVLSFTGYNEGYAMYSERYSYDYSGLSEGAIEVLKANDIYGYGLYSYLDLKVNYSGWSYKDVCDYMADLGYDEEISQELFSIAINDPCVYHRYFIGLVEMLELMDYAKELLGDSYSNINFNKYILEMGPTYYDIIKDRMSDWADRVLGQ